MTDIVDRRTRSRMMSGIRGKNTKPERVVRSCLHRMGYRFRLNRKDLPGRPDIVLPKYMTVVFVHGCFWHRHPGCKYAYRTKSNVLFWKKKFRENVARDRRNESALRKQGWHVIVVWECETTRDTRLRRKLSRL
jgi:DNA mismatch endonuclease (patch repair protein)